MGIDCGDNTSSAAHASKILIALTSLFIFLTSLNGGKSTGRPIGNTTLKISNW